MVTEYITLKVGDTFQIGDQIYIESEGRYVTIDEQVAKYRFVVAPGSVCRRPVGVSNSDRREWEEEEKESVEAKAALTLQEERNRAEAYLQTVLKENMNLHNEAHRLQGHVDSLKKQLAALEEKMHAAEKLHGELREKLAAADETMKADKRLHDELMMQARAERLKLTNERHLLQQEVHNLQHSLAAERRRLESLDAGDVEQEETELERKAWEIYIRWIGTKTLFNLSFDDVYKAAQSWISERDRRRKESGK